MIIRSLYNVSRQMNVLQKKQENNAANTANANTPGFKYQDLIQKTMAEYEVYNHAGGNDSNRRQLLGTINMGTEIDGAYTNFSQGALKETGLFTDFALNGQGFFTVATENGERGYTRNGHLRVSEDQRLVTEEGYPVLSMDQNGNPSEIFVVGDSLSIDQSGYLNGTGVRFMITNFEDSSTLEMRGENLYVSGEGNAALGDTKIIQGYLENSNVNLMDEIVKMMEVSREFQSNQKVISVLNDTLQKTVNEIGRN